MQPAKDDSENSENDHPGIAIAVSLAGVKRRNVCSCELDGVCCDNAEDGGKEEGNKEE